MFAKPQESNCDGHYSTYCRGDHGFHLGIKVEGLAFVGALAPEVIGSNVVAVHQLGSLPDP